MHQEHYKSVSCLYDYLCLNGDMGVYINVYEPMRRNRKFYQERGLCSLRKSEGEK
ncbi:MAG: hypothetical protein ACP5RI_04135 [Candidatus Micrarchaeia archaeon]